jgi:hypothetical protein
MSITLTKSRGARKIARIEGGSRNGEILYLKALRADANPDNSPIEDEFKAKRGEKLQPLPSKTVVEKIYVSAPSGAGKSYFVGKWLAEYKKMFKNSEIYLFSSVEEDESLDVNDPIRVLLDADLMQNPVQAAELKDSVVIFDDTDTIRNKYLRESIHAMRDEILEIGRHYDTRMLITSHLMMNYKETRRVLNEATTVVFFPKSGATHQIKKFLITYAGLDTPQIKKILKLPSRWVALYKSYPQFIIHERGAFLLSSMDE